MKSLDELADIREKTIPKVEIRTREGGKRITVGMATAGIAAGAQDVLRAIVADLSQRGIEDITVFQEADLSGTGNEPVVRVSIPESGDITYVEVKPEMAAAIVESAVTGEPAAECTRA